MVKVVYSPNKSVESANKNIDLWAYTVTPFATIKPMVYVDGKSLVSSENMKVIKTRYEPVQTKEFTFGQTMGFNFKHELTVNSRTLDLQGIIEQLSLYNYNPLNMALFSWTNTAVRYDGRPSCRLMESKITYDPKSSLTQKVAIELEYGLVHKSKGEPTKAISIQWQQQQQQQQWSHPLQALIRLQKQSLQSSNQQHQKLQQQVRELSIEEGHGLSAGLKVVFEGRERKSYSWEMTACHGFSEVEEKWNLELEDKERMNICVEGAMELPLVPVRDSKSLKSENMRFNYKNTIGFGKTCQEHKIEVTGTTSRSESLKVQRTESTEKCEEATRDVERLREELKSVNEETTEYRKMEEELVKAVEEKNEWCRRQVRELSTLDEVKFRVEYTPMPNYVRKYIRLLDTAVKGALVPFMTEVESGRGRNEAEVELKFKPHMNTVDMTLTTEYETIEYRNIRLPEQLREVIPLTASHRSGEELLAAIIGEPVYEKCTIGDEVVETYDHQSYRHEFDDCWTVLSADCGKQHRHSVLGKVENGKKHLMVFVHNSKVTMEPSRSYHESNKEFEIEVDGQMVSLKPTEKREVESRNGKVHYRIYRTADNVIELETPYTRVIYNGETIEIEHLTAQSNECGLCGDKNEDRKVDIKSAQQCATQTYEQAALSYRVQRSCSSLKSRQQQVKSKQQQKQAKIPVSRTLQGLLEKCKQTKHSIVRQG